jgi:hypothetical protein
MPTASSKSKTPPPKVSIHLVCSGWPDHGFEGLGFGRNIRVEMQTRDGLEAGGPAPDQGHRWMTCVAVKQLDDGTLDFSGPAVHGKRGERFFYLSWSGETGGVRVMFRRLKIHLREVKPAQWSTVMRPGARKLLQARVHAIAKDGGPACASVPLLGGGWTIQSADN